MKKESSHVFKKQYFPLVFVATILAGCNDEMKSDESLQGGVSPRVGESLQRPEEISPEMRVPVPAEESRIDAVSDRAKGCAETYERSNFETEKERETDLLDCLITSTYTEMEDDRPYALLNIKARGEVAYRDGSLDMENANLGIEPSIDVVLPFTLNEKHSILFQAGLDVYIHFSDIFNEKEYSPVDVKYNVGLVYRISIGRSVIGISVFYDYPFHSTHHRIAAGLDYSDGYNKIALNYYHPLTGWVNINDYSQERALGGFNIRYERVITKALSLYVGGEYFFLGHDFTVFDDPYANAASQAAVELGLAINFSCKTRLSLGIDAEKRNLDFGNFTLDDTNLGLSVAMRQQVSRPSCSDDDNDKMRSEKIRVVERLKNFRMLQRNRN